MKNALAQEKKDSLRLRARVVSLEKDFISERKKLLEQTAEMKRQGYLRSEDRRDLREKVYTLERKAARYERINMLAQARQKERDASSAKFLRRGHGGAYSNKARELAQSMTAAGCSREKVGKLIRLVGHTFGIEIKGIMSRRTVSRSILEAGVAAKIQMAYEIKNTEGEYYIRL